jgi:hypothetical protein
MRNFDTASGSSRNKWIFWIIGTASVVWLLLRSGPDPRRLRYPCQRAVLAGSAGFFSYLISLVGAACIYKRLRHRFTYSGVWVLAFALLLTSILTGSQTPKAAAQVALILNGWTSPTAISDVFVASNVPVPLCSLNGGTLPSTPPCNSATFALRDPGVDSLISEMENRGEYFYKTSAHTTGIVGNSDVVVIKVNNQWGLNGHGNGLGRLSTNTDVLKGLVWRILQHPSGFTGEVVVAENTQDSGADWNTTPANSQDRNQSYQDVVAAFQGLGYSVSLSNWSALNTYLINGGDVGAGGYPTGEYATGNNTDAYILLEDPAGSGTNELSYPKFRTTGGTYVSMRYGVWNGSGYDADRLTVINMPVLKRHGMAGATIAWKNLIGFVTTFDTDSRYGDWDSMHDFYWGYTGGANSNYGLVGRQMALIRSPDLNVVDAIWVADDNYDGDATRQNILLACSDPFAVDWYASEYILHPLMTGNPNDVSAARGGIFRNASRTNQNATASVWPGGSYPYIDLLDSYNGSTPSDEEKNQMNVYVVSAQTQGMTGTPLLLLLDE